LSPWSRRSREIRRSGNRAARGWHGRCRALSRRNDKVRALIKGGTLDAAIDKDFALGQTYRVNQTPTTVFHSKGQTYPYSGVMTYDVLKTFLEQLLSQK